MTRKQNTLRLSVLATVACLFAQTSAYATNGYFSHGYGIVAKGMGGAATAMTQDSFGGANNPASMVWVGNRIDVGADWFQPSRDAQRAGAGIPTLNGVSKSSHTNFVIPEFGYNRILADDMSFGLSVYGNGGLNTSYAQGRTNCGSPSGNNLLCGSGNLGVDMMQLIIAPTLAKKLTADHSVGISLLVGYQRFKADGLQAFDNAPGFPPFTGAPGSVTNKGYDSSTGFGIRLGYLGKINSNIAVGAAYASKMNMKEFSKYKGLFAENGDFDIPANFNIGVVITPDQKTTVAVDFQRISYSGVKSINNASLPMAPLGAANGPGFGWKDVDVLKLGAAYRLTEQLQLRAGYNHGSNPISAQDVTFNIIAPGTVQTHYTMGLTYAVSKGSEISASYMHAPRKDVSGSSLFNNLFPAPPNAGGTETIGMSQNSLGLAWSNRF